MTAIQWTLTLSPLSDWRIGLGMGRRAMANDEVQRHPKDKLPFVPQNTITGLLRDHCTQVAKTLDSAIPDLQPWQQWCEYLFGRHAPQTPTHQLISGERHLHISDARYVKPIREQLRQSPQLREALTFLKAGVSIDRATGAAKDKHFYLMEVVRQGGQLEASLQLHAPDLDPQQRLAIQAILWAGAAQFRYFGGSRRRGLGRCQVEIDFGQPFPSADVKDMLLNPQPPQLPERQRLGDIRTAGKQALGTTQGEFVQLKLELLGPVTVTQKTLGNVVKSHDFIPGGMLLEPISQALMGDKPEALAQAIRCGEFRVSNAAPLIEGQLAFPAPRTLKMPKRSGGYPPHFIPQIRPLSDNERDEVSKLTACQQGYVTASGSHYQHQALQSTLHNVIDPDTQRPTQSVGGIYTRQSIAPGQIYSCTVYTPQAIDDHALQQLQDLVLRVGQAKGGERGRCKILEAERITPQAPATYDDKLTLWLTSTLLLDDDQLRPASTPDQLLSALASVFGASDPEAIFDLPKSQLHIDSERIDGWNRRWQLPRPSLIGLAAGSVLKLTLKRPIQAAKLAQLQSRGLGLRRAEGFGQLQVNPEWLEQDHCVHYQAQDTGSAIEDPSTAKLEDPFLHFLAEQALWQHLQALVTQRTLEDSLRRQILLWSDTSPSNSQLGRLRQAVSQLRVPERSSAELPQHTAHALIQHFQSSHQAGNPIPTFIAHLDQALCRDHRDLWSALELDNTPAKPLLDSLPKHSILWLQAFRHCLLQAISAEFRAREQLTSEKAHAQEEPSNHA